MKILLTGASGFLGSALARRWASQGHSLVLLLRPHSELRRLAGVAGAAEVIRCATGAEAAAALSRCRPDIVVHTACSYGRDGEPPLSIFESNLQLGLHLLDAALALRGAGPIPFVNTGTVLAPELSLYALSKQQLSAWGLRLASDSPDRLHFLDLRLQHMYGPGDHAGKFTAHVITSCLRNEPELRLTAGEQRRDFIYIDDVVDAYDVVVHQAAQLAPSASIDVGSGDAPSVREFVEQVHLLCGSSTRLLFGAVPYRAGEAMLCRADTTMLRRLGWAPRHSLLEGLQRTLAAETTS